MSRSSGGASGQVFGPLGAFGLAALAVACCIAIPVLVAALGGMALAVIIGGGAGLAGAILLLAAILALHRRRRSREVGPSPASSR